MKTNRIVFPLLFVSIFLSVCASLLAQAPPAAKLTAFWDFNDPSVTGKTLDKLHGFVGELERGAAFTDDKGGRTAQANDRAMDFGATTASQLVRVRHTFWLNTVSADDQMTVAFWQKLRSVVNSSAFWMASPSSSAGQRGAQAHVPWGNRTLYFDTAGCCDGSTQRLQAGIDTLDPNFDFTQWHHFAFVKNGAVKQIWIDGTLFFEGENTAPLPTDFTVLVIGADSGGGSSMQGWLDDFAVFSGALDPMQLAALAQGASPTSLDPDTDADGLPNWWEDDNGLNKADKADAALDSDNDVLTNLQEYQKATNPKNADSDSDGFKDGVETNTGVWASASDTGTSPLNPDTDGDGLNDGVENNTGRFVDATNTGTSPLLKDSDGDRFPDSTEIALASSPTDVNSVPTKPASVNLLAFWDFNNASDAEKSTDKVRQFVGTLENGAAFTEDALGRSSKAGDRAMDFGPDSASQFVRVVNAHWLNAVGAVDRMTISFWQQLVEVANTSAFWLTSPSSSSSSRGASAHAPWGDRTIYFDTAGCCDASQRINRNISGLNPDFDFAQWHHYAFVKNGAIKQIWIDGQLFLERTGSAPLPDDMIVLTMGADLSGGGSIRGLMDDFAIFAHALDSSQINALTQGISPQEFDRDTDADGMPDIWEDGNGLNKADKADAAQDPDTDGLTNLQEFLAGTNPKNADTDADGLKDGVETKTGLWVSASDTGTNPINSDTDGDSLKDGVETNTGRFVDANDTGSNPLVKDTDGDGLADGVEVAFRASPTDAASSPIKLGGVNLIAFWDYNNAAVADKTADVINGFTGTLENGAVFTADQGGRTGKAGDRAMDFGVDSSQQLVRFTNAVWLNAASSGDRMTVAFWQQVVETANTSAFWIAPGRASQAHVPWGNRTLYFDTAGCCDAGTQRINASIDTLNPDFDFAQWHHFAFVKNGLIKQIWIDGQLFLQGTNTSALPTDMSELVMGAEPSGGNSMRGLLDDFAIFGSALDPAQINALAQGASPKDLKSLSFAISKVALSKTTQAFSFSWDSEAGQKFVIQRSSDLRQWTMVGQVDASAGATTTFSDTNLAGAAALFYRIQKQ